MTKIKSQKLKIKKPFVSGVFKMLKILVKNIPHHDEGFRILFSASLFPQYQAELT